MNKLLIVAVVLDPRYKLQYVSYCFSVFYGATSRELMTSNIKNALVELYECYSALYSGGDGDGGGGGGDGGGVEVPSFCDLQSDDSSVFDLSIAFSETIENGDNIMCKNEVERYLLEPVEQGVLNIIEPFHRFVGEDMMTDLKYPLKDNTIPFWAVPLVAILLPLIIINIYYFIRRDVYDLHHAILGLLYSVLVTGVITDAIKDGVGRPRPDFFWRCFPDGKGVFDNVTKNVMCTGNKLVIKEGHKSFPSGHTSWSFAGLGFLALYMSGKVRAFDRKGHVAKLCIVFLPYLVAALVGVSRVDDYWHHWQDVFGGAIIGIVVATFCYLQFFPPPYDPDGWGPHAYFQVLADSQNGRQATNNNASCLTIQSSELESVYVEPGHRGQLSRTNTHDASPILDGMERERRH
ncbi:hypothetical protein LWI29_024027 [Acer saccharum]|uniref:Phosphatidic acid phosphatase type 2/haloperoxidase domain-containing protein n=1 Tax=Acer saccharum TaxID=4024 RepID=A0AA39RJ08_ACESA|nr:hypothetical protein LWI29_024027 [Acer saccharum]